MKINEVDHSNYDGADQELESIAESLVEQSKHYDELKAILNEAYKQSAYGKGRERHADDNPWEEQPICWIAREVGTGYTTGQAIKKIVESQRLLGEAGIAELLGAIVYIAGTIKVRREADES